MVEQENAKVSKLDGWANPLKRAGDARGKAAGPDGSPTRKGTGSGDAQRDDPALSDYNSKITGATDFSYLSEFSEVERAKEDLKQ